MEPIVRQSSAAIAMLKQLPPAEYVLTPHWAEVRTWMLTFADHKCVLCESKILLDVHHNNYRCLGEETYTDLVVLCRGCHKAFHRRRKSMQIVAANAEQPHGARPSGTGTCPVCGAGTTRLTNKHTGVIFYGCTNYPACVGSRNASREERSDAGV